MKQHLCRVVDIRTLFADVQLLTLDAPDLARSIRPGQFVLARDPSTFDPYLRRTLWLYQIDHEQSAFTLDANDALAIRTRMGDTLDVLSPLGHVIDFESSAQHILLIGEGTRLARLVAIAHAAVQQSRAVVVATTHDESRTTNPVFPMHLLSPEIEYRADGLNAELMAWADAIVASGSMEMYRALADAVRAARCLLEPEFARVLIDQPMPCGTGACYACAVETARGVKLACTHGAWFDLVDFENRRLR